MKLITVSITTPGGAVEMKTDKIRVRRMTFIYSAILRAELYTPEATESIATTGDRPGR